MGIHTCLAWLRMSAQCQSDGQRVQENNHRDAQSSFPDQEPRMEAGTYALILHSPEESHLTTQTVTAILKSPQQTAQ